LIAGVVKEQLFFKNSKEKIMTKSMRKQVEKEEQKEEQMVLMDTGPENLKEIVKAVRVYKGHQSDRIIAGKKEVKQREIVRELVKNSKLKRLKNGSIKFEADGSEFCVTPQDDLITIKEKKTKKQKKTKK
jgi:hypothetical protein